MKNIFLILLFLIGIKQSYSQTKQDSLIPTTKMEYSVQGTRILNTNLLGLGINFSIYSSKRTSHGIYFSAFQGNSNLAFNYPNQDLVLNMNDLGMINEYNIYQNAKFQVNANLTNGFTYLRVGDNAVKQDIEKARYNSKELHSEYYFLTQPGLNIVFPLGKTKKGVAIDLSAQLKYKFLLGNKSQFLEENVQNSYTFLIGISMNWFKKNYN